MSNKVFVVVGSPAIPQPNVPKAQFAEKPFPRVVVMRRTGQGSWVTIARDVAGTDRVVDADPPPSGRVEYRIAYVDEAHRWGPPSGVVTLASGR